MGPLRPVLVAAALLLVPLGASAQCPSRADTRAFSRSVGATLRCRARNLVSGTACASVPPPVCAGSAVADLEALAFGAAPPTPVGGTAATVAPQLRCQRAIASAVRSVAASRLRERLRGKRRQGASRRRLGLLPHACDDVPVVAAGAAIVPTVGGPCAGVLGGPGSPVDVTALTACVRAAIEGIVDGVAPARLAPSIVLVLTDDQRADTLAYMPAVRALVGGRGVEFTNAFVTTPLCCPSRSGILSGQYAHNTGVKDNAGPEGGANAFDDTSTIATWLSGAGYATGLFGKYMNSYHVIAPHVPPGWTTWQAFVQDTPLYYNYTLCEDGVFRNYGATPAAYSTDLLAGRAADFVRTHADEPFLLYYAPFAPHAPSTPADRHAGSLAGLPPWRPPSFNEDDIEDKPSWVELQKFLYHLGGGTDAAHDAFRIAQLESLAAVDEAVAALVTLLEDLGLGDQTLVIFTSDNGHSWGEHWHWGKESPYEESIRVPLVARLPMRVPLPRVETRAAQQIDLAPTFAELAGVSLPPITNGASFLPLLDGAIVPWRTATLEEGWLRTLILIPTHSAIRTDAWKWIEYDGGFRELYNLVNDPYEMTNVASDPAYAALAADLAAQLAVLRAE